MFTSLSFLSDYFLMHLLGTHSHFALVLDSQICLHTASDEVRRLDPDKINDEAEKPETSKPYGGLVS